jgi:N-acetylmuramoyl-L-alanine amidase
MTAEFLWNGWNRTGKGWVDMKDKTAYPGKLLWLGLLLLIVSLLMAVVWQVPRAEAQTVVKEGSVGGYVWELQGRLQFLGFYHGKIDGVFGRQTYWAVRNFQYQFGLEVDGVVGPKTKEMLWKATRNWPGAQGGHAAGGTAGKAGGQKTQGTASVNRPVRGSVQGFSQNDIKLMANAVYGEARGEPYIGQVAVAAVILNRVESPLFPDTPAGVIFEPGAFTAVADGQIWLTPNETAKKAVEDAINGWDPTGGALYYFNPDTATSAWIWTRPQIKRIGKHIFCL